MPDLRPLDPRDYRLEVAAGWLWLAARAGAFGKVGHYLSRRQMQAADSSGAGRFLLDGSGGLSFGGSLPGAGSDAALSYPDLGLVVGGGWIALHAQLRRPAPERLAGLLSRYAAEPAVRMVMFLVERKDPDGDAIIAAAERLKVKDKVRVQLLDPEIAGG